jgi:HAMP domain-containing protein
MQSLRSRFIFSHLLPILLVVPLVTILLLYLLETQILLAEMSEEITEKANLIADTVNGRPELLQNAAQAESFIAGVSIYVDEGILLISPQGDVVAATETTPGEPLAEEVDLSGLETAVSGNSSLVITYGVTQHQAIVLVPVKDINQQLIGIIGVTDTLAGAASQISRLRSLVLAGLLLELLLGVIIGMIMARRLGQPIISTAAAVVDIADGHQIDPVPIEGPKEIRALGQAVNTLSERYACWKKPDAARWPISSMNWDGRLAPLARPFMSCATEQTTIPSFVKSCWTVSKNPLRI